jgi:hypothetical protein
MGWPARVWFKSAVGASKAAGVERVSDHSVKPRAAQSMNGLSLCGKAGAQSPNWLSSEQSLAVADCGFEVQQLSLRPFRLAFQRLRLFHVQFEPAFFTPSGWFTLECPRYIAAVVQGR